MEEQKQILTEEEREKRSKRFLYISIAVHALILLLLILVPLFHYTFPPPGKEGVLVSFGQPDIGQGDDTPDVQDQTPLENFEALQAAQEESPQSDQKEEAKPKAEQDVQAKLATQDKSSEVQLQQQENEKQKKIDLQRLAQQREQQRLEEQRRKEAEIERQRKEAEARQKAEFEKKKKQFGDFLSGSGKGNTKKSGNRGDPTGDPDASILSGISKGSGKVGGGLSNRGVVNEPEIKEKSQKTGRVVLKVCVDRTGKVVKANYTQRGSTTTDTELKRIAVENAYKWRFTPSNITQQCGTITVDFKLK